VYVAELHFYYIIFSGKEEQESYTFLIFIQPLEKAANTCPGVLQYHVGRSAEGSTGVLT